MTRSLILVLALCTLSAAAFAGPGGAPVGDPPLREGPRQRQPMEIQGTVKSYNLTPRGEPESMLLMGKDKIVQINFPPQFGDTLAKAAPLGAAITVTVAPDGPPNPGRGGPNAGGTNEQGRAGQEGQPGPGGMGGQGQRPGGRGAGMANGGPSGPPQGPGMGGDGMGRPGRPNAQQAPAHPVFRLISVKDAAGKELSPPQPDLAHVEGTVSALNYDRRALVNGAQLNTGDLLRFGPREAQQVHLKIGDTVSAEGPAEKMATGKLSLQVLQLNGQDLRPQRPGNDGPPPPPGNNDDGMPPPPPQR